MVYYGTCKQATRGRLVSDDLYTKAILKAIGHGRWPPKTIRTVHSGSRMQRDTQDPLFAMHCDPVPPTAGQKQKTSSVSPKVRRLSERLLAHDLRGDVAASSKETRPRDFVDVARLLVESDIGDLKETRRGHGTRISAAREGTLDASMLTPRVPPLWCPKPQHR